MGDTTRASRVIRSSFPDIEIPNQPLGDVVLGRASELGDKPALIDGPTGRTISYAQLAAGVRRAAAGLAARGFRQRDVLAIFSPNVPEYAIAFHAVASLGGVSTTVNPLYTPDELAQQLSDAHATYVLTVPPLLDKVKQAIQGTDNIREIFVFGEAEGATPFAALLDSSGYAQPPRVGIDPQSDLVVLPYSSGTTGLAKGVMLTHHNLLSELCIAHSRPDIDYPNQSDTLVAFLPFFHIYGVAMFLNVALWQGSTVVCMPRFDLEQYLELIQRYRATYLHLVPPVVLALAKHPIVDRYDLSSVRWAFSSAAPLGETLASAFTERLQIPIFQAYGMTEVSGATHVGSCRPGELKPSSGGRLLSNLECLVVDVTTGEAVDRGQLGEIWVRGPLVMKGYLGRPEATAATVDAEGWLHTGDVGYVDRDGDIFIVDRVKELIKYKGLQVAPAELEAVLLGHPKVADAAVIPSPDEEAGEVPKAFVVAREPMHAQELLEYVAARVAPHKKIRRLEFIDAVPKSAAGKILRRVLVEQERARTAGKEALPGASAR